MVVAKHQDVLVKLVSGLLVQREQVVLRLDFTLGLELLPELLLFGARSPDRSRLIGRVPIRTTHPLQAPQLLIVVRLVVILVLLVLLLLFLRFGCGFRFAAGSATSFSASFRRLLALCPIFLTLAGRVLCSNLLRSSMTPDVRDSLHLALLRQFFGLLLLLL